MISNLEQSSANKQEKATKGFVTVATGSERYYKMALNLMISAKVTNPQVKFAVITDKNNPYIDKFDDVVILENPKKSYVDKIDLLIYAPYDYNLFIDADCLIFDSLEHIWEACGQSEFGFYGVSKPLENPQGNVWFELEGIGEYRHKVHFHVQMHGGIYFVKRGEFCKQMHDICMNVLNNYDKYKFFMFTKPADEPVIALAASVMNASPIGFIKPGICFYPMDSINNKIKVCFNDNTFSGVEMKSNKNELVHHAIIHFGNKNTDRAFYKAEAERILAVHSNKDINYKSLLRKYKRIDTKNDIKNGQFFFMLAKKSYRLAPALQSIYRKIRYGAK